MLILTEQCTWCTCCMWLQLVITDNDLIEKSNLNRQFLFRPHHIRVRTVWMSFVWLPTLTRVCANYTSQPLPGTRNAAHPQSHNIPWDVIGHVTIPFAICHFLTMVYSNWASISQQFWDIRPTQVNEHTNEWTHQPTNSRITIPPGRANYVILYCKCYC